MLSTSRHPQNEVQSDMKSFENTKSCAPRKHQLKNQWSKLRFAMMITVLSLLFGLIILCVLAEGRTRNSHRLSSTIALVERMATESHTNKLFLQLSLHFANATKQDGIEYLQKMRPSVIHAISKVLCAETVIVLLNASYTLPAACLRKNETRGPKPRPSVVLGDPRVSAKWRSDDTEDWSVWTFAYSVVTIGDIYWQEAWQNDPHNTQQKATYDEETALEAMRQVTQLAIDVYFMDGEHNKIMEQVYASAVDHEMYMFASQMVDDTKPVFERSFHVERAVGVILMLATVLGTVLPSYIMKRRRAHEMAMRQMYCQERSIYQTDGEYVIALAPIDVTDESEQGWMRAMEWRVTTAGRSLPVLLGESESSEGIEIMYEGKLKAMSSRKWGSNAR